MDTGWIVEGRDNWDQSQPVIPPWEEPDEIPPPPPPAGSFLAPHKDTPIAFPTLLLRHGSTEGGGSVPMVLFEGGRYLAVGSSQTIDIWDLSSGQLDRRLRGHRAPVYSLCLSPNGSQLLSGSADAHICVWSLDPDELQPLHWISTGRSDEVLHALYSPDGSTFATAHSTETVTLYSSTSGEVLHAFRHPFGEIERVLFTPDGRFLIAYGFSGAYLWDLQTKQGSQMNGPIDGFWRMLLTADGKWAVTGALDGFCRIWETSTGSQWDWHAIHTRSVEALVLSPDGRYVASGSVDGSVAVWDLRTGKNSAILNKAEREGGAIYALAYSRSGEVLAAGTQDGHITLLESLTGTLIGDLEGHHGRVRMLMFTDDDETLLSYSDDGNVRVWRMKDITECL